VNTGELSVMPSLFTAAHRNSGTSERGFCYYLVFHRDKVGQQRKLLAGNISFAVCPYMMLRFQWQIVTALF
jgi:hypothetical protein